MVPKKKISMQVRLREWNISRLNLSEKNQYKKKESELIDLGILLI